MSYDDLRISYERARESERRIFDENTELKREFRALENRRNEWVAYGFYAGVAFMVLVKLFVG